MNPPSLGGIPLDRIAALFDAEKVEYERHHPLSRQKIGHGIAGFYGGVPMDWMLDWPMPCPASPCSPPTCSTTYLDGPACSPSCSRRTSGSLLFNLIPAFPMDGGRILRSLLSMRMVRTKATRIATMIGRVLAICFVILAFYDGAPFLGIIGLFIFMAAGAEARVVQQKANVQALRLGQRVRTDIPRMAPSATVQDA